jgi:hypothetical protein
MPSYPRETNGGPVLRWRRVGDPKKERDLFWYRRHGPYRLTVFDAGAGPWWAYTVARQNRLVACVPFAAESPMEAMAKTDEALAEEFRSEA